MFRHRFDDTGGRFPGALVSLLKPAQAFVDNPSHVKDPALPNNHLANRIAGLFVPDPVPEDWWAAGVNINYRIDPRIPASIRHMIMIRNTSGFTGGSVGVQDIIYWFIATPTHLSFLPLWPSPTIVVDDNDVGGWVLVPKFGTNEQRKSWMDLIKARTGSELKPEFKTWT